MGSERMKDVAMRRMMVSMQSLETLLFLNLRKKSTNDEIKRDFRFVNNFAERDWRNGAMLTVGIG